jgi:CHASE2 domain-containing sensor protein
MAHSIESLRQRRAPERGLPAWAALLVLIAIAALGGVLDTLASIQVKGGFNIGIVIASIVAILIVKRSHMFPIVIAPPIVYSGAALFQLYVRSSGLHDKKVVLDAAANYLVYGFPAIAAATAAVLIIAGCRLIIRK